MTASAERPGAVAPQVETAVHRENSPLPSPHRRVQSLPEDRLLMEVPYVEVRHSRGGASDCGIAAVDASAWGDPMRLAADGTPEFVPGGPDRSVGTAGRTVKDRPLQVFRPMPTVVEMPGTTLPVPLVHRNCVVDSAPNLLQRERPQVPSGEDELFLDDYRPASEVSRPARRGQVCPPKADGKYGSPQESYQFVRPGHHRSAYTVPGALALGEENDRVASRHQGLEDADAFHVVSRFRFGNRPDPREEEPHESAPKVAVGGDVVDRVAHGEAHQEGIPEVDVVGEDHHRRRKRANTFILDDSDAKPPPQPAAEDRAEERDQDSGDPGDFHRGILAFRENVVQYAMLICIGGTAVDLHARVEHPLVFGSSNPGRIDLSPGGVARNIAENAARLDVPVTLVTWPGSDPLSAWVLEKTRDAGVRVLSRESAGAAGTARYLSILQTGEPLVAVSDFGAIEELSGPEVVAALDAAAGTSPDRMTHRSAMTPAPLLVAADCNLPEAALTACIDWCDRHKAELLLEPVSVAKGERLRTLRGRIAYVTPNTDEARVLGREPVDGAPGCPGPDIGVWIVTRGARGAAVWRNGDNHAELYGTSPRPVVNANGAGDAFVAGFLAGLHERVPIAEAVSWGLAAGAITVTSAYTVAPDISRDAIRYVASYMSPTVCMPIARNR